MATPQSVEEFAHALYDALQKADAQGINEVVVVQPAGDGIAVAIRDRLARVSNKRE